MMYSCYVLFSQNRYGKAKCWSLLDYQFLEDCPSERRKKGQVEVKQQMHFYGRLHFCLFQRNIKHKYYLLSILFT